MFPIPKSTSTHPLLHTMHPCQKKKKRVWTITHGTRVTKRNTGTITVNQLFLRTEIPRRTEADAHTDLAADRDLTLSCPDSFLPPGSTSRLLFASSPVRAQPRTIVLVLAHVGGGTICSNCGVNSRGGRWRKEEKHSPSMFSLRFPASFNDD